MPLELRSQPELDQLEYIVWPIEKLEQDAIAKLDRQIRDVIGPDVKVVKEMLLQGIVLLAWLLIGTTKKDLLALEKLSGVQMVEQNVEDEDIAVD
ncbi:hypothetical protein B0A48_14711 [Cryoendolithus antarcticus]|uniref:Uncharacterized protein n=1 Tax=Cryoendolithus antarcticus TaxID=1507870 RepID=A0A1V8SKF8_9PEZI|nr:hypothetical protein B0A48_14711 [Cryoendolithus antarcticus]